LENKTKCPHGLDVNPITNEHIFPQGNTYTIKEHDDGKTYTVIDHQQEQPKQEYDTEKLIAEARSLIEYNKRFKEKVTPVKTKRELELERRTKEWEQYYADNQGKIPREFPKSIFDKE
jgi:hypothetical protein